MSTSLLLLCLAYLVHLLFTAVLGIKIIGHNKQRRNHSDLKTSVIVAARNESEQISSLLEALAKQSLQPFEAIIVNDRSTDTTGAILEKFSSANAWLKIISIKELPTDWTGKKHALYQAAKNAKGDFLLFTDADCTPASERWIEEFSDAMDESTDIILGFSPYNSQKGILNQFIQWETLITGLQYLGMALIDKPYMGVGRNMAIRREKYDLDLLHSIKHLEGGDDDLMVSKIATKSNTKVLLSPKSQTYSIPKIHLPDYLNQKIRHLTAGKHYHQKDQTLLGIFTLSWMISWFLLVSLIFSSTELSTLLIVFGIRSIFFYSIIYLMGRKLKTKIKIWALPLLDLCYCLYYPLVAFMALATKKVEWK